MQFLLGITQCTQSIDMNLVCVYQPTAQLMSDCCQPAESSLTFEVVTYHGLWARCVYTSSCPGMEWLRLGFEALGTRLSVVSLSGEG